MVERDVNAPPSSPSSEGSRNPPPSSHQQPGGRKKFDENYREYLQALKNAWSEVDVEALDVHALKAAREATELAADGCWGTAATIGTAGSVGGSVGTFGTAGTMGTFSGIAEADTLALRAAPRPRRAGYFASYGSAATSATYGLSGRRMESELAASCYGSLGTAGTIGTVGGTAATAFCLGTAGSFGVADSVSIS